MERKNTAQSGKSAKSSAKSQASTTQQRPGLKPTTGGAGAKKLGSQNAQKILEQLEADVARQSEHSRDQDSQYVSDDDDEEQESLKIKQSDLIVSVLCFCLRFGGDL